MWFLLVAIYTAPPDTDLVHLTDGDIWNRAIEWREKIKDWNKKHPDASWQEHDQFCRDNDMPPSFTQGHLMWL